MEEFIEALTRPVDKNFFGWGLLILVWILILFLLGIIVYGIMYGINFWFRPMQEGYGMITGMEFESAHYSTNYVYNAATKTSMPVTTWHPDAWKLIIQVDGQIDDLYLDAKHYVNHKIGEQIRIKYTTGRLWKSVSIKSAFV